MPRVLDAHTMLEHAWPYLCGVEHDIQEALPKCDHRDLLPDLHGAVTLHGAARPLQFNNSAVVTPVMTFHTRQQLETCLGGVAKAMLGQLKPLKPKAIGNLWVACSVDPSRMCYEMTLAVPFSKEK